MGSEYRRRTAIAALGSFWDTTSSLAALRKLSVAITSFATACRSPWRASACAALLCPFSLAPLLLRNILTTHLSNIASIDTSSSTATSLTLRNTRSGILAALSPRAIRAADIPSCEVDQHRLVSWWITLTIAEAVASLTSALSFIQTSEEKRALIRTRSHSGH